MNDALCKKVMADLLGACAQIHSAGVFHRDIKVRAPLTLR